jgi:hypothetical protein
VPSPHHPTHPPSLTHLSGVAALRGKRRNHGDDDLLHKVHPGHPQQVRHLVDLARVRSLVVRGDGSLRDVGRDAGRVAPARYIVVAFLVNATTCKIHPPHTHTICDCQLSVAGLHWCQLLCPSCDV